MTTQQQSTSSTVNSSQTGIHPRLLETVGRHLQHAWRGSLHPPTVAAFAHLKSVVERSGCGSLIFDSGCGNGASTRKIAQRWPDSLVIGVDKSVARLNALGANSFPHSEGNAIWSRMELATFWRLALEHGWRLKRHFLLYPNPWPKPGQLRRRWHGHPAFPVLLALGGKLEMRCNWEIYAREFAGALQVAGADAAIKPVEAAAPVSPFERKYRRSGHALWSVESDLRRWQGVSPAVCLP